MQAKKFDFRTVDVSLSSPFTGWTATMKAEGVSARVFIDLQSGDVERIMLAVAKLVLKHNFLDESGKRVESVIDAPLDALTELVTKWSEAVAALPPR